MKTSEGSTLPRLDVIGLATDMARGAALHRDPLFEAIVSTATRDRDETIRVDATWHAGLVDAVRPEHAELLTWLDRARDCARAA